MQWTAEAVEDLKRMALEGRSASVIAGALGAASRCAVIGKANRIGVRLNGGGRGSAPCATSADAYRAPSAVPHSEPVPGQRRPAPALSRDPEWTPAWPLAEVEVGEMRRVRFDDIRESICRWPLGDPMSGDFAYCGLKSDNGRPYCAGHCRMAYRPPKAGPARPSGDGPARSPIRGACPEGVIRRIPGCTGQARA